MDEFFIDATSSVKTCMKNTSVHDKTVYKWHGHVYCASQVCGVCVYVCGGVNLSELGACMACVRCV